MRISRIRVGVAVCAAVAALLASASAVQAAVISHWAFDSDFTDATGNHDAFVGAGSPNINTADYQFGGGALDLNGSSYLDTGSWPLGGSYTVAAWVKPGNIAADWRGFFGKHETSGQKVFWLGQHSTDGRIRFGNYYNGVNESPLDVGYSLTNGEWVHVVASWDDANDLQTVYINGREVAQISRPGVNQVAGTTRLQIGAVGGNTFQGLMDEAWLFDEALTPQQVENLAATNDINTSSGRFMVRTYDFESGDLAGWNIVNTAHGDNAVFTTAGNQPAALPHSGSYEDQTIQGDYWIRTWEGEVLVGPGDSHTGIIETDPFVLGKNARFDFRIGGGNHPFTGDPDSPGANITALNLERLVAPGDWEMIFTSTGRNVNFLSPDSWDASAYEGQIVRLRIYDTHTGGWGHPDVDDIRYSVTSIPESTLWSVDIQGTGSPTTMLGVEPNYGHGKIWNAFTVAHHSGTSTDPSMALVDSNGNPTGVVFSINGTVSGYNYAGDLEEDYLFIDAGNADANIDWTITGLQPNAWYQMYLYGNSLNTSRDFNMLVDTNGNGSLADETLQNVGSAGFLYPLLVADATGTIHGQMLNAGHEGNWAGFQLRYIPEPSTFALLGLGLLGLAGCGWRRRKAR